MAYLSQPTVTRPANVTAYTAGDVVGGVANAIISFADAGPMSGAIMITSADLRIDVAAVPVGMTSFRLHLYNASPASALADNAVWDLTAGDRAAYLGYIDLGSPVDVGSTLYVQLDQINKQLQLGASATTLYGYLVTNGGFTPAGNSEVYTPRLSSLAMRYD